MNRFLPLCGLLFILLFMPLTSRAELAADLSSHLVTVRSNFSGESLVLFGSLDAPLDATDNVVVTVRGPGQNLLVRRKQRVAGIWINRDKVRFLDVPAFYRWYAAHDGKEALPLFLRERHQIGVDVLDLQADGPPSLVPAFHDALLRQRINQAVYMDAPGMVTFITPTLFRTEITFPQQVPVGLYRVDVYLFRKSLEGPVAQTTPLTVAKDGVGAEIAWLAGRYPLRYGLGAILLAILAGAAANAVFQRKASRA